jgi:hypothetical protein
LLEQDDEALGPIQQIPAENDIPPE